MRRTEGTMTHTQHYVHLLSFPFRGENAAGKFAIACLVIFTGFIIPVVPIIFYMGYVYQVMRTIVNGGQARMPLWTDLGRLFRDGLKPFGINFIFSLPLVLIFFAALILYIGSFFGMIIAAEAAPDSILPLLFPLSWIFFMVIMVVANVLQFFVALVLPVALGNLAAKDRFSAGFHFKAMWRVFRANAGGYLLAYLIIAGLFVVAYYLSVFLYMTMVFCVLLPFYAVIALAYLGLVSGAHFAEAYRVGAGVPLAEAGDEAQTGTVRAYA
jgi:hypothetical protein